MDTSTMYGALFKDGNDHYLLVEPLGFGMFCQTQLVRHCETGELRVRKVLHRRPVVGQRDDPNVERRKRKTEAEDQFNNDVKMTRLLANATRGNIKMRMPELFSDSTTPADRSGKYSRVSYWGFCNGGNLDSFANACWDNSVSLPCGLVLRFLQQMLEMLHAMYTQLPEPVFHGDLYGSNILLHFAPRSGVPDFYLADFGQAYTVPNPLTLADDKTCGWDVPGLMDVIENLLFRLTMEPVGGPNAVLHSPGFTAILLDPATTNPICVAYQMLRRLDQDFTHNKRFAIATGQRLVIPDLTPTLAYVRDIAMQLLPELMSSGDWAAGNAMYRRIYGQGPSPSAKGPALYLTPQQLLAIRNVPGPWFVAQVEPGSLAVQKVIGGARHRPNEETGNSDTDSAWCSNDDEEWWALRARKVARRTAIRHTSRY